MGSKCVRAGLRGADTWSQPFCLRRNEDLQPSLPHVLLYLLVFVQPKLLFHKTAQPGGPARFIIHAANPHHLNRGGTTHPALLLRWEPDLEASGQPGWALLGSFVVGARRVQTRQPEGLLLLPSCREERRSSSPGSSRWKPGCQPGCAGRSEMPAVFLPWGFFLCVLCDSRCELNYPARVRVWTML